MDRIFKNSESKYINTVEKEYVEIRKVKEILINLSNDIKEREFYGLREKMIQE